MRAVREAVDEAGLVPLVVAPAGGVLGDGDGELPVHRTYATARSVEFDAVLLVGAPGLGGDACGARDAKAGSGNGHGSGPGHDPRVALLLDEAFRHGKAIGGWKGAEAALEAAGVPADAPGVVVGDSGTGTPAEIIGLLGAHRVWERFPAQV